MINLNRIIQIALFSSVMLFGGALLHAAALPAAQVMQHAAETDEIMSLDKADQLPQVLHYHSLDCPAQAEAAAVEGYVVLPLLIDDSGAVERVEVDESVPAGIFDDAAIDAVRQWRFKPARHQGRSVRVWSKQRVRFDLSDA